MARRVDQVERVVAVIFGPGTGGSGRLDSDTSLLFLFKKIHRGSAVMDLAHLVCFAGVVEHSLGNSRLASIDVGADTKVPGRVETGQFAVVFDR